MAYAPRFYRRKRYVLPLDIVRETSPKETSWKARQMQEKETEDAL